ncbi:MAG: DNA cytosine methyltransferase [Demequinaceae bacterium]|nr:DNA cytosine methyltransferase [Demequinaceae bacterium]
MFSFADLFAGIGGFHAALSALGGKGVFASEIDSEAQAVYERNWHMKVDGDIIPLTEGRMAVPSHDVLTAGFPCQPFSKSGFQRGMSETRGTLFWNICRVLEERKPGVVLLENVRNLAGPRHTETWATIVGSLRDLGYKVSSVPTVFSPHLLPPTMGGRPQIRDRVFITATRVGRKRALAEVEDEALVPYRPIEGWDPSLWNLASDLPLEQDESVTGPYALSDTERLWIEVWEDFIQSVRPRIPGGKLPGFPIWADSFLDVPEIDETTPAWKADFLQKNSEFYLEHRWVINQWLHRHDWLSAFPPSRRKLEWQAQETPGLWDAVIHFRPSGIRAKKPTYVPALVAITQTSVVGALGRRITPREAARLQGLPDWFDFGSQQDSSTYRQLGNGVNVGAAYFIMRQHVLENLEDVEVVSSGLVEAVSRSSANPDAALQLVPLSVQLERSA